MKHRFSSLDVKVIAHELSDTLCGLRVANCYDLSSRIFLFKFHKPGQREQLVVNSGFRCHLTSFARTTAAEPSAFVARLRKHLKTRRVTSVQQVGTDRVIEFTFSDGMYRVFLEFHAGGNVILCDKDFKVITLLRRVPSGAGEEEIHEGMIYSLEKRQNFNGAPPLTLERLRTSLQKQVEKSADDTTTTKSSKNSKRKPGDELRRALALAVPEFPPVLVEHAFRTRQFDSSTPPEDVLKDEDKLQRLLDVLDEAKQQSDSIVATSPSRGFIIAKPAKQRPSKSVKPPEGSDGDKENVALVYEDFHPFRPRQFEDQVDCTVIEIVGFNKTVDDFFSSQESQQLESKLTERELRAQRKIEAARQDLDKRIGGLQQVQELNVRKAQAIEANLQRVEEATAAVNGLVAQGMDWEDISSLIQTEKNRQNPVATVIKLPLKLHENTVTLLLAEEEQIDDEADYEFESQDEASEDEIASDKENSTAKKASSGGKLLSVDIDLALTAWANAGQYYDEKRTAAVKEEKTVQASEDALKQHEKKVQADLKKGLAQEKQVLRAVRQQLWFEKFFYFISSEGYLVLGARDKTQSDILYKRHLGRGDVWVHANLEGASHVVVKNRPGFLDSPIPPSTLAQAGTFCICSSDAWDRKAIMGAWWVKANQVTKLAPNGDYLQPGVFEVKGEKEHLPPAQLVLGFGVLFKLDAASALKRTKQRVPLGDIDFTETHDGVPSDATGDGDDNFVKTDASIHHDTDESDYADSAHENEGAGEGKPEVYQNPLQNNDFTPTSEVDEQGGQSDDPDLSDQENDEENTHESPNEKGIASKEKANGDTLREGKVDGQETKKAGKPTDSAAPSSDQGTSTLQIRGKHGKKAKIKTKYAWQDDEDRALALRLLGSSKGQEKKAADAGQKAEKEAADAAAKERRREQHRIAQQRGKEAEEARQKRLMEGSKGEGDDEAESEDLSVIEKFVGMPKPGDVIDDFLVVCAPWDSLGPKLRWRVKLQPGPQKKSQAIRGILGGWERDIAAREKKKMPPQEDERWAEETTMRREGELIRTIKDVEVIGCMPMRTCRAATSGGDQGKGGSKGKGNSGGGSAKGKGNSKGGRGGKGSKK